MAHVCPWWMGYLLISPLRKIFENPKKLLKRHIKPGMQILEVGPGMGFFTIPMAKLLENSGMIHSVDMEAKMLAKLQKRAKKKKLHSRVSCSVCSENSLDLKEMNNKIDFTLLMHVVHEVPDHKRLFNEISELMKAGGKLYIAEPKGHVTQQDFQAMLDLLGTLSFDVLEQPIDGKPLTVLLEKR